MGSGPGPHGQVVGQVECIRKSPMGKGNPRIAVAFRSADKFINVACELEPEAAEYFVVGETYSLSFTTP